MVECGRVLVMCDDKGVVHAAMVVEHGIDRRVALHQDEADPSRIEEGHVPARNGGQMVTADNFCVEPRASRDVAPGAAAIGTYPGAPRSAISSILWPNTAARVPSIEVSRALTSGTCRPRSASELL